jgi:hypothetical protein
MSIKRLGLVCLIIWSALIGTASTALSAEIVMLRAGEIAGPNAVFILNKDAKSREIVVRTTLVGVAGSRLSVTIDKARRPAFSHIFTPAECKFDGGGSKCEFIITHSSPAYARTITAFRRGLVARVTVVDAGAMKMDQTVSLSGFTKALRR